MGSRKLENEEEKRYGDTSDAVSGNPGRFDLSSSGRYEIASRSTRSSDETLDRISAIEAHILDFRTEANRQLSEIKDDKARDAVLVKRELAIIYTSSYLLVGWFIGHFVGWVIHDPFPMPKEFIAFICVGFGGGLLRIIAPYIKR